MGIWNPVLRAILVFSVVRAAVYEITWIWARWSKASALLKTMIVACLLTEVAAYVAIVLAKSGYTL